MMNKRFTTIITGFAVISALLLGFGPMNTPASATTTSSTPECDDNAVVRCGIYSTADMKKKYTGDVKAAYNHFGITDSMIDGSGATIKNGTVLKNGDVIVDGKVIATGAITAGRHNIGNSTAFTAGGTTFYERPTTTSFVTRDVFDAYVFVDKDGKFLGAVLKPCGNPAKATPKPVPPKPSPEAACKDVKATKISRNQYRFTASATTSNGATISSYTFTFSGPATVSPVVVASSNNSASTETITFDKSGDYTVTATVKTSVGDRTGTNCEAKFTVAVEPVVPPVGKVEVCDPATGQTIEVDKDKADQYKPVGDVACQPKVEGDKTVVEALPVTGPVDILAGAAGLGSVTAAGYYFRASRSRLFDAFKQQ